MPLKVLKWSRGLAITLTFNPLTSQSNEFIFVLNCIYAVNLVKFRQAVYIRYRINKMLVVYDHENTHGCTDAGTILMAA